VIDVRTRPRSKRHPMFDAAALAEALTAHGIEYVHRRELGGWRTPRPDSINIGLEDAGLRGYADHLQAPEGRAAVERLVEDSRDRIVALMCAEADPARCHRSLLCDALLARGIEVEHILGPGSRRPHRLTAFARVDGARVTYPSPGPELPFP
jgi:uncharacterized protein (DUF488 family)